MRQVQAALLSWSCTQRQLSGFFVLLFYFPSLYSIQDGEHSLFKYKSSERSGAMSKHDRGHVWPKLVQRLSVEWSECGSVRCSLISTWPSNSRPRAVGCLHVCVWRPRDWRRLWENSNLWGPMVWGADVRSCTSCWRYTQNVNWVSSPTQSSDLQF